MRPKGQRPEFCRDDQDITSRYYDQIPDAVSELLSSYERNDCYHHMETSPIPSIDSVVQLIDQSRQLLFPGYFSPVTDISVKLEYKLGQEMTHLFELLSDQIILAFKHDCLRYDRPCSDCAGPGREAAVSFLRALPKMRDILGTDVRAALEGDPAAMSTDEVIFSYPGLYAIIVYRIAHTLYDLNVPLLPRMMTEFAHSRTGIDINPGAVIGDSFFIDHGTGVVVGETTTIGSRVRLYQGVTLGALSLPRNRKDIPSLRKRHPTIEDDVIIYANTTVLGGETTIGARSVIGGNIWITESVPADTKVLAKRPELVYINTNGPVKEKRNQKQQSLAAGPAS